MGAVIASAVGAAAGSATAVGADCCGPSNRDNIGISTFSDRNHSNSALYSRFAALMALTSRCSLSKSALKAATSSSDITIILYLTVPAPRRCLSYILLCCSGPRWPPYQLYHNRISRPLMATVLAGTKCPEKVCTPPARLTNVYVAPLVRLHTAQTPIPSCLHQARYIDISC